jgi:hypothetical protein
MSVLSTGIDVPVSEMPVGMAFDDAGASSGGFGDFLGSLGKGVLGALGGTGSSSGSSSATRTPYTDQTRSMLNYLISEAIKSFEPAQSTIS